MKVSITRWVWRY